MNVPAAQQVLENLLSAERLLPNEAEQLWKDEPGIYAIFVDAAESLPEPYLSELISRETDLIYVGKAERTLIGRCIEEEMRHKRAATFFRSIGAMLGYVPDVGSLVGMSNQYNYRFSCDSTREIVQWMENHLQATAVPMPAEQVDQTEAAIIRLAKPLINIQNNPDKFNPLVSARERCRSVARGIG